MTSSGELRHPFGWWLLREGGYEEVRRLPSGAWLAVQPQLYTVGLFRIRDEDRYGYECRWCYQHAADAILACATWDAVDDDPPGPWVKQKGRDARGRPVDRLNPRLGDEEAEF